MRRTAPSSHGGTRCRADPVMIAVRPGLTTRRANSSIAPGERPCMIDSCEGQDNEARRAPTMPAAPCTFLRDQDLVHHIGGRICDKAALSDPSADRANPIEYVAAPHHLITWPISR